MPVYEYICQQCGRRFEALVSSGEKASCPCCGGQDVAQQISVPTAAPRDGGCGNSGRPRYG